MPYLKTSLKRNLTHDTFNQCRLTLAILTYKGYFLASLNGQIDIREYRMVAIALSNILTDHRIIATTQTRWELQMHCRIVDLIYLDRNDFLQLLYFLLYLYGLSGLITEAFNKLAHLSNLFLLVLVGAQLLFTTLFTQCDILVVLYFIVYNPTTGNLQRPIRHIINKRTIVTDQHYSFGTLSQELLQPLNRLNIKMVSGLIKQQHIRLLQQDLCQFDTHAPTATKLAGRSL